MWRLIEFHFTESAKQLTFKKYSTQQQILVTRIITTLFPAFNTCQIGRDEEFSLVYILDRGLGRFFHNNLQKENK